MHIIRITLQQHGISKMYFVVVFCVLWCGGMALINNNNSSNNATVFRIQLPLSGYKNGSVPAGDRNNSKTYFQNIPLNNNTTLGVRLFQFNNQTNKPLIIKRIVVTNSVTLKPVQSVFWRTIKVKRRNRRSGDQWDI